MFRNFRSGNPGMVDASVGVAACLCAHEARVRVPGNGVWLARADSEPLLVIDTKLAVRNNIRERDPADASART